MGLPLDVILESFSLLTAELLLVFEEDSAAAASWCADCRGRSSSTVSYTHLRAHETLR